MENGKWDTQKKTYEFALRVIKLIDNLPKSSSAEVMAKQVLRSATSIGANVVEAQSSPTRKDFTNYFSHSLKSANETKYWLQLLRDSGKITDREVSHLIKDVSEIAKVLGASLLTLKGQG